MFDRETMPRLLLAVLLAVVLHVLAVPLMAHLLMGGEPAPTRDAPQKSDAAKLAEVAEQVVTPPEPLEAPKPPPVQERRLRIGRAEAEVIPTAAWIPYDHFQELQARARDAEQPALQREANPTDQAPLLVSGATDPTVSPPELPREEAAQAQREQAAIPPVAVVEPAAKEAVAPAEPREAQVEVVQERAPAAMVMAAADALAVAPAREPAPETMAATEPRPPVTAVAPAAPPPVPAQEPKEARQETTPPAQTNQTPRPTAATRHDRESPIVAKVEVRKRQQGRVQVSRGLELLPAVPRVDIVTLRTVSPVNPVARLVFNRKGEVVKAELLKSAGHAGWDSPILNSLYRWRATGAALEGLDEDLELIVGIDLR